MKYGIKKTLSKNFAFIEAMRQNNNLFLFIRISFEENSKNTNHTPSK